MIGSRAANCGFVWTYLAVDTLRVEEVVLKREIMAVDVREDVRRHLGARKLGVFIVDKIEWEPVDKDTTKLAVQVTSHGMVLVYELYKDTTPIIIQQDVTEGIELFFWVPLVAVETSEGSYKNCKQLIIYTKNHLQVKLYSLDFVNILWKLTKPISQSPILNPQNHHLWSLVLASRSADVSDQTPVVYHFYNQGPMSNLLYRFKLPMPVLTEDYSMFWTQSGKWLVYFNWIDLLFGFKLQVYNSLGVNQNLFNLEFIPTGDPIIDINWMTRGFESHEFACINYWITDLWVDELSEYLFVVLLMDDLIQVVTVSIKDFRVISKETIDVDTATFWSQHFDGKLLKYVRGKRSRDELSIKKVFTKTQAGKFKLIVQFEASLVVCDILFNDENSTKLILFKPVDYIITDRVDGIEYTTDIVVTTATHIFTYDFSTISVIHQGTTSQIIKDTLIVFEKDQWNASSSKKRLLNTSFAENDTFFNRKRSVH